MLDFMTTRKGRRLRDSVRMLSCSPSWVSCGAGVEDTASDLEYLRTGAAQLPAPRLNAHSRLAFKSLGRSAL